MLLWNYEFLKDIMSCGPLLYFGLCCNWLCFCLTCFLSIADASADCDFVWAAQFCFTAHASRQFLSRVPSDSAAIRCQRCCQAASAARTRIRANCHCERISLQGKVSRGSSRRPLWNTYWPSRSKSLGNYVSIYIEQLFILWFGRCYITRTVIQWTCWNACVWDFIWDTFRAGARLFLP